MHPTTIFSLLLPALVATAAATEFQIITTHKVECARKTEVRPHPPPLPSPRPSNLGGTEIRQALNALHGYA